MVKSTSTSSFFPGLTVARAAVVVALLTTELGLEESFRALGKTLSGGQLPPSRTRDALVPARSAAGHAAQVALGAHSAVAVVAVGNNVSTGILISHL